MMSSSTRFPRQSNSMQIYQDPETYDHAPMPSMQSSGTKTSPLRALKNASSRRNIIFNQPHAHPTKQSPVKSTQHSSSSPNRGPLHNKLVNTPAISMPPPGGSRYQTDSMLKKQPNMATFNTGPQKALFTTFISAQQAGKENYHPNLYQNQDGMPMLNFSMDPMCKAAMPPKRALMDSAPFQESSRPMKKAKMDSEPVLPSPVAEQFPVLHDDGTKPGHSYASLIGMAILRAPNRRLTLAQIYKWISDTYSYYNASETGWQNSIRHNLSLNKAFVKQERPKDDPGKGNYWAIEVGMESQFFKEKSVRKGTLSSDQITPIVSTPAPHHQELMQSSYKALMPATELPPPSSVFMPSEPVGSTKAADLSSDATIPASDTFGNEEEPEEDAYFAPPSQPIQSSPPPMMHSSPPVPRHAHSRSGDGTPPQSHRFSASSRDSRKRRFASMDDSGFYSSLGSSALRGHGDSHHLTSDADRPRKALKRGRAEEAIARLRGSSYDSPTKARSFLSHNNNYAPPSSSPLRRGHRNDSNQMLPPLTPAIKLKAPMRPPPSVSPNTNLKMHRDRVKQLVGSPTRDMGYTDENLSFTPQFQLDENHFDVESLYDFGTVDIFADQESHIFNFPGDGSPEKKSAKRPRLEKSHSANVLSEISANSRRSNTSTPLLKLTPAPKLAPSLFESPCKRLGSMSPPKLQSPSLDFSLFGLPQEDFLGAEFLTEDLNEFDGVDISQGFQKIGSGPKASGSRPAFGRSSTTNF